jgi:hypothetical protein
VSKFTTHLQGRLLILVRVSWILLVGLMLVSFLIGIPIRHRSLLRTVSAGDTGVMPGLSPLMEASATSRLTSLEAEALQALGISRQFYAGYMLAFDLSLTLIGILTGLVIAWRKSNDWMALWISFILMLLATNGASMVVPSLALISPAWILISYLFGFMGMVSNVHLMFNSPDGKYVPRWTKAIATGFTGIMLGVAIYSVFLLFRGSSIMLATAMLFTTTPVWMVLSILGIFIQIYRYLRVSDRTQRQQTKWVAFGLIMVTIGFAINAYFLYVGVVNSGQQRVFLNMLRAPLVNFCFAFLPVCLAISVLRYRLWDIDLIIRRTLQYTLLTGLMGLMYFVIITVLQNLFSTLSNQQSPISIVLSTLAIAALFNPLRKRVQDFIDRRFYRQKYDAEKALADFSAAARSETDLQLLSGKLVDVVQQTVQPESARLWLTRRSEKTKSDERSAYEL